MPNTVKIIKIAQPLFDLLQSNPDLKAVVYPEPNEQRITHLVSDDLRFFEKNLDFTDQRYEDTCPQHVLLTFNKNDINHIQKCQQTLKELGVNYIGSKNATGLANYNVYKADHHEDFIYSRSSQIRSDYVRHLGEVKHADNVEVSAERVYNEELSQNYPTDHLLNYQALVNSVHQILVIQNNEEFKLHEAKNQQNATSQHLPAGLDVAIDDALNDDALSIYEVEIGLFDREQDPGTPYDTTNVAVASDDADHVAKIAIDQCKDRLGQHISFEALTTPELRFSQEEIDTIKSGIENTDRLSTAVDFHSLTGHGCEFLGNSSWAINDGTDDGQIVDEEGMAAHLIKSLYNNQDKINQATDLYSGDESHHPH